MRDVLLDEHALQLRLHELDFGGKEDREFEVQRRARLAPRAMPRRGRPQYSRPEHDMARQTKTRRDSERHSHAPKTRTLPRSPPPYVPPQKLEGPFNVWGGYSPHYDDTFDDDDVSECFAMERRAAANAADAGLQRTLRHITAARDYEGVY